MSIEELFSALLLLSGVCLLLGGLTRGILYYKAFRRSKDSLVANASEPVSVVVVCDNQADMLRHNLPAILRQDYPQFEVILVNNNSADDTKSVIELFESGDSRVRHTYVPQGTRCIHTTKLAISLGIKAAKHERVVLTRADCRPLSPQWLRAMSAALDEQADVVVGYSNYVVSRGFGATYARIGRLVEQLVGQRLTASSGWSHGGDACNLALRKSVFIRLGGYGEALRWLCGEDLLLLDRMAAKRRTCVRYQPECAVEETVPYSVFAAWTAREVARTGARRLCRHRAWLRKNLWWSAGVFVRYLLVACLAVCACLYAVNPLLLGVAGGLFVAYHVAECLLFGAACKRMGEKNLYAGLLLYEYVYPLHRLRFACRWRRYKRDFIRYI